MSAKTTNQKAWLLVAPVVVLVALNAVIPLMTVVNYSLQETFGNNLFFWAGVQWFQDVLQSERFHAALGRQLLAVGQELADHQAQTVGEGRVQLDRRRWTLVEDLRDPEVGDHGLP